MSEQAAKTSGKPTSTFTEFPIKDLRGRVAIVTGGYVGLGGPVSKHLSSMGATVVLPARRPAAAKEFAEAVSKAHPDFPPMKVPEFSVDLGDLDQVEEFTAWFLREHSQLDMFIGNAGVAGPPSGRTKQGYEVHWGINHMAHVKMLIPLLPLLRAEGSLHRVVLTASRMHQRAQITESGGSAQLPWEYLRSPPDEDRWLTHRLKLYGNSKLANILTMRYIAARAPELICASVHPGAVATNIFSKSPHPQWLISFAKKVVGSIQRSEEDGGSGVLWAALADDVRSGGYYYDGQERCSVENTKGGIAKFATDDVLGTSLWHRTLHWLDVEDPLADEV